MERGPLKDIEKGVKRVNAHETTLWCDSSVNRTQNCIKIVIAMSRRQINLEINKQSRSRTRKVMIEERKET